jgi:hypothetical protein
VSPRYTVVVHHFREAGNCGALLAVHCDGSLIAGELGGYVDGVPACGACTEHAEITNELMDRREGTDG